MPGRPWQLWNWIDAAALPVLGALTWSAWAGIPIAALIGFVTNHQTRPNAGPVVLLLLLGGTLVARLSRSSARARWYLLLSGLVSVFLAEWWLLYQPAFALWNGAWLLSLAEQASRLSPAPILVAIITAVIWRYGVLANWNSHDELTRAFLAGVVALGLGLFTTGAATPGTTNQLVGAAVQFLAAGWAALSLAGVAAASRTAAADAPPRLNRYWLLSVVTVVGTIFALALALTSIVTPPAIAGWIEQLQPVVEAIRLVLLFVLYIVSFAIFWVLTPLIDLFRRLTNSANLQPIEPFNPFVNPVTNQPATSVVVPQAIEWVLRGLVIVALLVALGLILAWALRRQSATDQAGVRESRELIWSWDLLRAQLGGLLARQPQPPLFPGLAGEIDDPIVWVRQAYRQVLAQALAQGQARQPRQTPHDYLPTLGGLWPAEAEALAALTMAYTAARYGQVPPSAEQLAALQSAMERIARAGPGSQKP